MGESQTVYKEKLFHSEDPQTLKQGLQRGFSYSIPGGFQVLAKTVLSNLAWPTWFSFDQDIGLEVSWGLFQYKLDPEIWMQKNKNRQSRIGGAACQNKVKLEQWKYYQEGI